MQILTTNIYGYETAAAMNSSPIQRLKKLVLAESKPITFQPLVYQLKKIVPWVERCSSYIEVLEICDREAPDILLLGTLADEINCLEVYRKCRNQWHHLPIILLANQAEVNDRFRDWAMKQGVSDVVSSYPQAFEQLQSALEAVAKQAGVNNQPEDLFFIAPSSSTPPQTMEFTRALMALNEISEYSQRYFGPLALGNYWKKAHQKVVGSYPCLNEWSVDHCGKIECLSAHPLLPSNLLTTEQFQSLQAWTKAFLEECKRVVVDFPQLLKNKHLSSQIDRLLS